MAVADRKEPVRAAARQCYWALRRKFPGAADAVMDSLDASRQKHLYKEQASVTSAMIEAMVPTQRFRVINGSNGGRTITAPAPAAAVSSTPAPPMPEPPALLNPGIASERQPYHNHVAEPPLP